MKVFSRVTAEEVMSLTVGVGARTTLVLYNMTLESFKRLSMQLFRRKRLHRAQLLVFKSEIRFKSL